MAQGAAPDDASLIEEYAMSVTAGAANPDWRRAESDAAVLRNGLPYKDLCQDVQGYIHSKQLLATREKRLSVMKVLFMEVEMKFLFFKLILPNGSVQKRSRTDFALPGNMKALWDAGLRATREMISSMESDPSALDPLAIMIPLCVQRSCPAVEELVDDFFAERPGLRTIAGRRVANWAVLGFVLDELDTRIGTDRSSKFKTGRTLRKLKNLPNGPDPAWLLAHMPADVATEASKIFADPVVAAFNDAIAGAAVSEAPLVQSIRAAWQRFDFPGARGPTPCQAALVGRLAASNSNMVKKMVEVAQYMGCEPGFSGNGPLGGELLVAMDPLLEAGQNEQDFLSKPEAEEELAEHAELRAPSNTVLCVLEAMIMFFPLVPSEGAGKLAELVRVHKKVEKAERKARAAADGTYTKHEVTAQRQENRQAFGAIAELVSRSHQEATAQAKGDHNDLKQGLVSSEASIAALRTDTNDKFAQVLSDLADIKAMMSPRAGAAYGPPPPGPAGWQPGSPPPGAAGWRPSSPSPVVPACQPDLASPAPWYRQRLPPIRKYPGTPNTDAPRSPLHATSVASPRSCSMDIE